MPDERAFDFATITNRAGTPSGSWSLSVATFGAPSKLSMLPQIYNIYVAVKSSEYSPPDQGNYSNSLNAISHRASFLIHGASYDHSSPMSDPSDLLSSVALARAREKTFRLSNI